MVSSAVSVKVSFFISKTDWSKVALTKIFLVDFVLWLLSLSLIIFGIILIVFWILRKLAIFAELCSLIWKKWNLKEKYTKQD